MTIEINDAPIWWRILRPWPAYIITERLGQEILEPYKDVLWIEA